MQDDHQPADRQARVATLARAFARELESGATEFHTLVGNFILCAILGKKPALDGSNPSPSSAESGANLTFCDCGDASQGSTLNRLIGPIAPRMRVDANRNREDQTTCPP